MSSLLDISVVFSLLVLLTNGLVSSQQSVYYFFYQRPAYPRDCKEALDSCLYQRSSGVYVIKPDGYQKPFAVYCDNTVDSGGWTIILRRYDGSVAFRRNWIDYKLGFGFLSQELWIGHEKLSFLTNQKMYELRIDIVNSNGTSSYALYTFFRTSDDFSNYRITGLGLNTGTLEYTEQNCEHQSECYCVVDGVRIQEGETHMFPACLKICSCLNGQVSCDNSYQCTTNEICELQNSIYQCSCDRPGYVRVGDSCVFICSDNEVYGTCTCETSCGNPQVCLPCSIPGRQCYCPAGFYLNGQDCVPLTQCGCFVDGVLIPEGQTHMFPNCLKSCFCLNGEESCDESYQCTANEICELQNSIYQCSCDRPGYVRVGDICEFICSDNEVYGTCTCETSCGNPQVCLPCSIPGEQCYCPTGFYLKEEDCVSQDQCGCYNSIDDSILRNGETYVYSDCSQKCTCNNDQLSCTNYECSPNAECRVQGGEGQCHCNEGYSGDGETCTTRYTDCYDAYQAGERQDGFYSIHPSGWTGSVFNVPCNMTIDGGGWTVLQRRVDGTESFERNWDGYKTGFGVPGPEFWLGNDKIHFITNQKNYELRMDMVNLDGDAYFAKYNMFRISSETSNYQLELGTYDSASTANFDAMSYHRDQFFSTPDRDNDAWATGHCAIGRRAGWWYRACRDCDFNAPNIGTNALDSPWWVALPGSGGLVYTDIKIRPV